jgi:hypothetical protein
VAITYNVGNNEITVTGYTEIIPCNFTDLWNADKAGTLSLHARVGIAGVDGAAVVVDRAERPTDYVVLGGATGDLYITITNWNLMTNATIRITGTDRDGAAQTDDVVVNANGNFNAAKWFRTITHTQVTVFNTPGGGSFDYDLTQGQWGVIWKQGSTQFQLDCIFDIGVLATPTWFADVAKHVVLSSLAAGARTIDIKSDAHLRLGVLEGAPDKMVSNGCSIISEITGNHYLFFTSAPDALALYGCNIANLGGADCRIKTTGATSKIYHCVFTDMIINACTNLDIYELYVSNSDYGIRGSSGTFDSIIIDNCNRGFYCFGAYGMSASNSLIQNPVADDIRAWAITVDCDFTDVVCGWVVSWGGASTAVVNREYTFNLRVVDSDGVGIQNVTVVMVDKNDGAVFSVNTDVNGDIVEQTILLGYYNQANGNVIQPAGSYSPHTVTISKAGYAPRTIVYTMDRAREEIEKLGGTAPHGREYRRRRVSGEVSAMDEFE